MPESTGKGSNLCEYQKMEEYGRLPGKGRIRVSIDKLSRRVSKKGRICVSTEKWQNPDQYREKVESGECRKTVPVSTEKGSNMCKYRKMAESGSVPGKARIRASVEKLSR